MADVILIHISLQRGIVGPKNDFEPS